MKTNTPERNYDWAGDAFLCNSINFPRAVFYAGGLCWLDFVSDAEMNQIFNIIIPTHNNKIKMMHEDGPYSIFDRDNMYIDETGIVNIL